MLHSAEKTVGILRVSEYDSFHHFFHPCFCFERLSDERLHFHRTDLKAGGSRGPFMLPFCSRSRFKSRCIVSSKYLVAPKKMGKSNPLCRFCIAAKRIALRISPDHNNIAKEILLLHGITRATDILTGTYEKENRFAE